jgi:hypothetical protein
VRRHFECVCIRAATIPARASLAGRTERGRKTSMKQTGKLDQRSELFCSGSNPNSRFGKCRDRLTFSCGIIRSAEAERSSLQHRGSLVTPSRHGAVEFPQRTVSRDIEVCYPFSRRLCWTRRRTSLPAPRAGASPAQADVEPELRFRGGQPC